MILNYRDRFKELWLKYFEKYELPIIFYYSNETGNSELVREEAKWACIIDQLSIVREGKSLAFDVESVKCGGGKRYSGFTNRLRPGFDYFLSCGNNEIEGERYLQNPEKVNFFLQKAPWMPAKDTFLIFKRWDMLLDSEMPEVVIFFATPDVISALFTLCSYDRGDLSGSIAPFGSGCASIIQYPLYESQKDKPNAILGLFDISARPYVRKDELTFAVPFKRFMEIVDNMDQSFLITRSWETLKKRIAK